MKEDLWDHDWEFHFNKVHAFAPTYLRDTRSMWPNTIVRVVRFYCFTKYVEVIKNLFKWLRKKWIKKWGI